MIIHILRDITTAEPHAHGVAQQVVLYPVDALAAVAHQRTAAVVGVAVTTGRLASAELESTFVQQAGRHGVGHGEQAVTVVRVRQSVYQAVARVRPAGAAQLLYVAVVAATVSPADSRYGVCRYIVAHSELMLAVIDLLLQSYNYIYSTDASGRLFCCLFAGTNDVD